MRKSEWMMSAAIVATLCTGGLAGHAQQQGSSQQTGDPVADAARKAREDKKNAPKAKRVFTDDDVKPAAPPAPEKPAATAGGAAPGASSGAEGTIAASGAAAGAQKPGDTQKEDPNSEKAWRKRFSEQHERIARTEKEIEVLQRELDKSQTQYYADPTKALNEQNNRAEINDKTAKIAAKRKELDQLRQQLDDMESDLRKAGGDPAWAR